MADFVMLSRWCQTLPQNYPKMKPKCYKNPPQMDSETAPKWDKIRQDGPRSSKMGPNLAQDGPNLAQNGPTMAQDVLKMAQDGSEMAPNGPKMDQDCPQMAPR